MRQALLLLNVTKPISVRTMAVELLQLNHLGTMQQLALNATEYICLLSSRTPDVMQPVKEGVTSKPNLQWRATDEPQKAAVITSSSVLDTVRSLAARHASEYARLPLLDLHRHGNVIRLRGA